MGAYRPTKDNTRHSAFHIVTPSHPTLMLSKPFMRHSTPNAPIPYHIYLFGGGALDPWVSLRNDRSCERVCISLNSQIACQHVVYSGACRNSYCSFTLGGRAPPAHPRCSSRAMADRSDWKKAQAERLEQERAIERERLSGWWEFEAWKREEGRRHADKKGGWWGSRWWHGWSTGATENWGSSSGAEPTASAYDQEPEPTASAKGQKPSAPWDDWKADPQQDHMALRHAAMTPASFQTQRFYAMALGRPVVVLGGFEEQCVPWGVL